MNVQYFKRTPMESILDSQINKVQRRSTNVNDIWSTCKRGVKTQTNSTKRTAIVKAIDALASLGADTVTTGSSLSATWRLLWTTEKEQLFIIEKAYLDVLQVIDVITFPPHGVFFVRSNIEIGAGIDAWPGTQIHSHNYRIPEPFRDQNNNGLRDMMIDDA
ncbi:hypothetical protein F8388_017094 [Cannabis sativa]|uniref:Plastid lipid-associated protein/fibrillin conserved domain-containing protein n=1 Tax=Cannabis sativa TaxID=3483 RepID=A0A7J6GEQ1_CANSA|nr:hypothetical protein F8388_017094 [Cannabis sativa]